MKRRGLLKLLAGGAVAGPAMAQKAIAGGMGSLSLTGIGTNVAGNGIFATGAGEPKCYDGPADRYDPLADAKRDLAQFLGRSAEEIQRAKLETYVDRLDPDIAAMGSIALQSKIRMQRDRNFARNERDQKGWIERRIQNAIKSMAA